MCVCVCGGVLSAAQPRCIVVVVFKQKISRFFQSKQQTYYEINVYIIKVIEPVEIRRRSFQCLVCGFRTRSYTYISSRSIFIWLLLLFLVVCRLMLLLLLLLQRSFCHYYCCCWICVILFTSSFLISNRSRAHIIILFFLNS